MGVIMNEIDEEPHVAKLLIAELDLMDGSESLFHTKFHVLAENVHHYIITPRRKKTKCS